MNRMKARVENEVKTRKEIYRRKPVIAEQDYAREAEDWQSYHGRELLELLQNADDEITDDLPARVRIKFHNNQLTVSNNGEPFSEDGIVSLMYSNVSPKRKKQKEVIGNKGTGFRSILGWADRIVIDSGDLHVCFTQEYSQSCLDEVLRGSAEVSTPITAAVLAFPQWVDEHSKSDYTTDITITVKDGNKVAEDIEKQIRGINSELLLFLNRIEELIIETDEKTSRFIKHSDEHTTYIDCFENEVRVDHQEWFMNRSDDNEFNNKKYSVVVAYNKNGEVPQKQVLYNYFPTKIRFPYPVIVHADFDVNSNRNHLIANEENRAILSTVADMVIDTAIKTKCTSVSYDALSLLMPMADLPIDLDEYDFESAINQKIRNAPVFPLVNRRYVTFSDSLFYFKGGLAKYVSGQGFENLLLYAEDENVEAFIKGLYKNRRFVVYRTETLVNQLNAWVERLPHTTRAITKVAKSIVAVLNENFYYLEAYCSELKILFNEEFELVSSSYPVFAQREEIDATTPPKFARIEVLHPAMAKAFRKALPKGENYVERLAPLNVREYKTEDLIRCMNDYIEEFIAEGKIKKAKECSLKEIKWLWKNRDHIAVSEENYIYVPDRNGRVRKSDELYFGEEYGNRIGEKIISIIDSESFVEDLTDALTTTKENLASFLGQYGVQRFPRIAKRRVSRYDDKDYWLFVLQELKYPCVQDGITYENAQEFTKDIHASVIVDYIEGLEDILDACDTETIVEWIRSDDRVLRHLQNHKEMSVDKLCGVWRNYRVERIIEGITKPRSYIYYLFYSRKWITVKGQRYTINDCLLSLDEEWDLSPVLVAPAIDDYIKGLPSKKTKLRAEYVGLFEKLGMKRGFAELPIEKIYSVLLALPTIEGSGEAAKSFYGQMLEESSIIQKQATTSCSSFAQFLQAGKVYCLDGAYHSIRDVHYAAGKDTCTSIAEKFHIMELPRRRINYKSVPALFGVKRIQLKGVELVSTSIHTLNDAFQKDILKYKSLAFSYRVDAKKDITKEARYFGRISIQLCREVVLEYRKETIPLKPFEFFLVDGNRYYLCVPDELENIHQTNMGIAVSNIMCSYLDVYEHDANFRELFNAGSTAERMTILKESVDDATIQRARKAMNTEEDNKEEFIRIIDRLSDKALDAVADYIDQIDYESFSSVSNSPVICKLFRVLGIDVDAYNGENPSITLDVVKYNEKMVMDTLPRYKAIYDDSMYSEYLNKSIKEKTQFQAALLKFVDVKIACKNSVYFNAEKEIVEQLGIDTNCKHYDLPKLYKLNMTAFVKGIKKENVPLVDGFLQIPENASLLYFGEYEELKKRFYEYIGAEETETEDIKRNSTKDVKPIAVSGGYITPAVPAILKGKVVRETGLSTRNRAKLTDMGLRGERCVYEYLKSAPQNQCVLWVSENSRTEGINPEGSAVYGYDIEYLDAERGKCYVEVKASGSPLKEGIHFHMSENEYRFACENSDSYIVYYVASVNDEQPEIIRLDDLFYDGEFNDAHYHRSAKEYYISANYNEEP